MDYPITDVLQMMGRAGRPQFDRTAKAVIMVHEPKKGFYKKFLYEPFPVESALHEQLPDHLNAEIVNGSIASTQDAVNYLTWTYLYRRIGQNPAFYRLQGDAGGDEVNGHLSGLVEDALDALQACALYPLCNSPKHACFAMRSAAAAVHPPARSRARTTCTSTTVKLHTLSASSRDHYCRAPAAWRWREAAP